ncbi:hypothetical protein STAN_5706 [Streptomyces sp. CBMAI 2042]|nr:hypothetical protein STAN_5706 [Streptomyces sp. CBMAI 2042]
MELSAGLCIARERLLVGEREDETDAVEVRGEETPLGIRRRSLGQWHQDRG